MEDSRRKFLKQAGKVAAYVPPTMIALSTPSLKAIAQSGGCNNGVGNDSDCLPNGIAQNGKTFLDNDDTTGVPGGPQNQGGPQP